MVLNQRTEVRKLSDDSLFNLLQGLDSTSYPLNSIENEKIVQALRMLILIVNVKNFRLVSKMCKLIVTLIMQQKINFEPEDSDAVIRFLISSMEENPKNEHMEALRALGYVLYELPPKVPTDLYGRVVKVTLPMASTKEQNALVRRLALTCLSNFCCRSGKNLKQFHEEVFDVFFENFSEYYKTIFVSCKSQNLMVASLRGLASVILEYKTVRPNITSVLIPKMKKLAFYGYLVDSPPPATKTDDSSRSGGTAGEMAMSDSDTSESVKGVNRTEAMIRIRALHVIASMAKGDKRTILAEWQHLIPSHGALDARPERYTLATSALYDPSSKCRSAAAMCISCLLENSSKFFVHAEDKTYSSPFMSYSQSLSSMLRELHTTLLTALARESCVQTKASIIKAISALVANTPYAKLSTMHMLSAIVHTIRKLVMMHSDRTLQSAAVECTTSIFGGQSPLKEVEEILAEDSKLIRSLATVLGDNRTSSFMRIETATALSNVARNYHKFIAQDWNSSYYRHVLSALRHEDPTLRNSVMFFLRLYTAHDDISAAQWIDIIKILHDTTKDSFQSVRACSFFVYINMKPTIYDSLSEEQRKFVLRHIDDGVNDKQASVRAAAFRALGTLVSCPVLYNNPDFVHLWIEQLGKILSKPTEYLNVKIRACWVLANLGDVVGLTNWHHHRGDITTDLSVHTLNACNQVDKIRCNAVRGLGNIAQWTTRNMFAANLYYSEYYHAAKKSGNDAVFTFEEAMITELLAGSKHKKKVKWNACYALGSLMNNPNFHQDVRPIVDVLCRSVLHDENFKVRTQSSYALLLQNREYEPQYYVTILTTLLICHDASTSTSYKELKYLDKLKTQIRETLAHMFAKRDLLELETTTQVLLKHHATVIKVLEDLINKDNVQATPQFLSICRYIIDLFQNVEMEVNACISYQLLEVYVQHDGVTNEFPVEFNPNTF